MIVSFGSSRVLFSEFGACENQNIEQTPASSGVVVKSRSRARPPPTCQRPPNYPVCPNTKQANPAASPFNGPFLDHSNNQNGLQRVFESANARSDLCISAQECRFLLRSFSPLRRTITGLDASADATAVSKRVSYLWSLCPTRARKSQAMKLSETHRTTAN